MSERIIQLVSSIRHGAKISPKTKPILGGEHCYHAHLPGKAARSLQNFLGMATAPSGQILTRKLLLPKEVGGDRKGN